MKSNAINWFEIPVSNMDKAVNYYSRVFERELTPMSKFGMEMAFFPHEPEGTGATGALVRATDRIPSSKGTMVYFFCGKDLTPQLEKAAELGGKLLTPKTGLGDGMGFIAHFQDPDGNRIGLHSLN